jgi:subtilisin family serine protease
VSLTGLTNDLNIDLYNPSQAFLTSSVLGGTSPESINYTAGVSGEHYVRVYPYVAEAVSSYTIVINPATGTISGMIKDLIGNLGIGEVVISLDELPIGTTDSSGNFIITNVSVGSHNIKASKVGYDSYTMNVTASAGQTVLANITLKPIANIRIIVSFRFPLQTATELLAIKQNIEGVNGIVNYTFNIVPAISATVPEAAIPGLQAVIPGLLSSLNIISVELDREVYAIDVELDNSWGVKKIGADIVHARNNFGAGVAGCILDTGMDLTHPDLNGAYAGGYDYVNNDADPRDDNGHGTHVAGIWAARKNGSGIVGVAPDTRLFILKVLDSIGRGYWGNIIAALEWCVSNGGQVANLSLGSSADPGSAVEAAFRSAYDRGLLIVAAAGNSGNSSGTGDSVLYPARYSTVIAVAATDINNNRPWFSSTGPDVEIAAPGVSIYSTIPLSGYSFMSGTSMAAPHVSGVVALVLSAGLNDNNGNGRINDELRDRLTQTADDLGQPGRDSQYGFGLVDADEAVVQQPGRWNQAVWNLDVWGGS